MTDTVLLQAAGAMGWAQEERRLRQRLARNVLQRRTQLGLSREAAAHKASMHDRHWQKVETGEHGVTLRTLAKLADGLGVEVVDLLR